MGCRGNCPLPLLLTVASLTSVLVKLLMPAWVVSGLAFRNKSMTVCAGSETWSCLPYLSMSGINAACCKDSDRNCVSLNEGRSAVRLGP